MPFHHKKPKGPPPPPPLTERQEKMFRLGLPTLARNETKYLRHSRPKENYAIYHSGSYRSAHGIGDPGSSSSGSSFESQKPPTQSEMTQRLTYMQKKLNDISQSPYHILDFPEIRNLYLDWLDIGEHMIQYAHYYGFGAARKFIDLSGKAAAHKVVWGDGNEDQSETMIAYYLKMREIELEWYVDEGKREREWGNGVMR